MKHESRQQMLPDWAAGRTPERLALMKHGGWNLCLFIIVRSQLHPSRPRRVTDKMCTAA